MYGSQEIVKIYNFHQISKVLQFMSHTTAPPAAEKYVTITYGFLFCSQTSWRISEDTFRILIIWWFYWYRCQLSCLSWANKSLFKSCKKRTERFLPVFCSGKRIVFVVLHKWQLFSSEEVQYRELNCVSMNHLLVMILNIFKSSLWCLWTRQQLKTSGLLIQISLMK